MHLDLLSIVLPAYNEGQSIAECIRRASAAGHRLARSVEIIVVDDGSTDNTVAEARQVGQFLTGDTRLLCLCNGQNMGKGYALRQGVAASHGEVVVLLDADLDIPPEEMSRAVSQVVRGAPLAVASRSHPQSSVSSPLYRRIVSWGSHRLAAWLTGLKLRDTQCGLKAGSGPVLRHLASLTRVCRFAWDLELLVLARAAGYETVEVPVRVQVRPKDRRLRLEDLVVSLRDAIGIALRTRRRGRAGCTRPVAPAHIADT